MATTVARLEAILSARTGDFDRAMAKSETKIQKTGRVAGVAGLAIAGGLAYGIDKSVKAALAAQVSQSRLEVAFKTSGLSAVRYAKAVDLLEASGRKLGFTDEQTKTSLGSLLIATHSMSAASKDLSVAQDIARFKHVDLEQATKSLTMAMAGSQRALKQLGIDVPKVTLAQDALRRSNEDLTTVQGKADLAEAKLIDKHRTAALVIETVRQKLGGQADAYSKTAVGGMEQFRAQLDHLEVSMGTGLLPILAKVAAAVSRGTEYFSKHATMAKLLAGALGALSTALLAARAAQILMNLAVLANPYVVAAAAIIALGVAVYVFRDKLINTYNWIKAHWVLIPSILAGPLGTAVAEIVKHRDAIANAFTSLPGMIGNAIGGSMHILKDKLFEVFNPGKIKRWILEALHFKSPSPFFVDIGKQIITSIAHGVGAYAGILKHAVYGLAKSIPGRALGALGGAAHAVLGSGGNQRPVYGSGGLVPQVANAVSYARQHGWHGTVTSGYRTYAEQARLYDNYLHHGGPLAAKPGTSSHETGQAVDVTDYVTFGRIMAHAPAFERLYNRLGAADPVHYSVSGYAKGGLVPGPIGMPQLAVVHGGETVTPPGRGGNTYNTFSFPNYIGSQNELAGQIFDVLQAYENRNGRPYGGGF